MVMTANDPKQSLSGCSIKQPDITKPSKRSQQHQYL